MKINTLGGKIQDSNTTTFSCLKVKTSFFKSFHIVKFYILLNMLAIASKNVFFFHNYNMSSNSMTSTP